ncbi:MAG TPA: hypothetical protein VLA13_00735 [Massilibacterium sp.]|nr:hypothetical protein [Massilibacterium sp.]
MNRPNKQMIDVSFYKQTGKWYASGTAVVNHFLFEEGFKQDIVDTQTELVDGWQNDSFYVVTSAPEHVNGFFKALFEPGTFKGFMKRG